MMMVVLSPRRMMLAYVHYHRYVPYAFADLGRSALQASYGNVLTRVRVGIIPTAQLYIHDVGILGIPTI